MKKTLLFTLCMLFGGMMVNANSTNSYYYTNDNGVSMTENEYNYFEELHFEGYPAYVTQSEYNKMLSLNLFNQEIEKVSSEDIQTRSDYHETNAKILTLAKSCSGGECLIAHDVTWKRIPNVKSYDVMGCLFTGTLDFNSSITTHLYYSGGVNTITNIKYDNNGFGQSMLLPSTTSAHAVAQSYYVTGTGAIYGSYQHATSSITYANSKLYNISIGGYGGVFSFYGAASGVYDQMGGVNMGVTAS